MLNKIEVLGIEKGYFTYKKIKDIPKSCCNSNIEVIDFDETKEKLMIELHKIGVQCDLKSCDCLKMINMNNQIDLIEIKGIKDYVKYYTVGKSKTPKEQVEKYEIGTKYSDSLYLIHTLANMYSHEIGVDTSKDIKKIFPNLIILTDIDIKRNSMYKFAMTLSFLSTNSNQEQNLDEIYEKCVNAFGDELQKCEIKAPKKFLFCEEELEEYYKSVKAI